MNYTSKDCDHQVNYNLSYQENSGRLQQGNSYNLDMFKALRKSLQSKEIGLDTTLVIRTSIETFMSTTSIVMHQKNYYIS